MVPVKFNLGDTVKFIDKEEPTMTVIGSDDGNAIPEKSKVYGFVFCEWYENNIRKTGNFHQDKLELA